MGFPIEDPEEEGVILEYKSYEDGYNPCFVSFGEICKAPLGRFYSSYAQGYKDELVVIQKDEDYSVFKVTSHDFTKVEENFTVKISTLEYSIDTSDSFGGVVKLLEYDVSIRSVDRR